MIFPARLFPVLLILVIGSMASCLVDRPKTENAPTSAPGQQIETFLKANNLSNEQTTSTGLVYLIEKPGGPEKPRVEDQITIHYKGYLTDGTIFDQTKGSPRTFGLYQLIPAWQEAIPMIGRGGKIKILAPPSIAYGSNPPRGTGITSSSVLVFDIELVDF